MGRLMAVLAMAAAWLLVIAAPALAESVEPGTELSPRVIVVMVTPDLRMTDSNNVALKQIPVVPGETIMFIFSNTTGVDQNFYIGTADQLKTNAVAGLARNSRLRLRHGDAQLDRAAGHHRASIRQHQELRAGTWRLRRRHGGDRHAGAGRQGHAPPQPEPGPPYPPPVDGQYVYDYADIFNSQTEAAVQQQIQAIRDRTGAQIAVVTQTKPGATTDSTAADALALINQWGIGRKGFDDGMAILFNMDESGCHGQVQLYAAPGFQTFMSNEQRQSIYQDDMIPHLRSCDMNGAITVALDKVDAALTPENIQRLQLTRQINAAVGLIGGPLAFLVLVGASGRAWLRYGKDPVYLDDPSILMPAPPPGLTAASGAVIWEGQATRRTFTVGLLDLASRGEFNFEPEQKTLGRDKMGIDLLAAPPDDPYVVRNRRRPLSGAENYLLTSIQNLGIAGSTIDSTELQALAPKVPKYMEQLEKHVSDSGWFREPPKKAIGRWSGIGIAAVVVGFILVIWLANLLPSSGLTLLGIGLIAGGIATVIIAQYMPARTMTGAMIYAMLAAYRRTLQKTMAMSRSMVDVVTNSNLSWLETPDQAVVWGVALGLNDDVEGVLSRTAEDVRAGQTTNSWMPIWYGGPSFSNAGSGGGGMFGGGGVAPGLFSGSAIPDFGGMTAALGTIGVAPGSSGSGSSGGFGGGGGGGGGGGAGGGF